MMLSGIRWQRCSDCPARFAVLIDSTRTRCLSCEAKQKKEPRRTLKPGRPRKYKNADERRAAKTLQQRSYRSRPSVEKIVCNQLETKRLWAQKSALSHTPLSQAFGGFAQR
jgi:hypothetical protein